MLSGGDILKETGRQIFHALLGLVLILFISYFGRVHTIYLLSATLFLGFLLINFTMRGFNLPIISRFLHIFERETARLPGYGSAWYIIGLLICCLLIPNSNQIAAAILVLALGDAAATIFGAKGKVPLPYNSKKSLEGTLAFFIFSLSSYIFIGWYAIPLALIAALAESLPWKLDDNLIISLTCSIFFYLI